MSTKQTPFYANHGFHPSFKPQITKETLVPAAIDLVAHLDQIHVELWAKLNHAQQLQAWYYNQKCTLAPELKIDQLVWLLCCNIKTTQPCDKLNHHQLGPYWVVQKIGSTSYLLSHPLYCTGMRQ